MFILTWLTGLLRHRAARLAGSVLGVAMTVALLGSLGVFFAASKAQMTRQALAGVVVDWQVQLAPGAAAASAGRAIARRGSAWCELDRSEEHTSELQSRQYLVCRLLLGKKR